jgi:hypothetical protein
MPSALHSFTHVYGTGSKGTPISLTDTNDPTSPVSALHHHFTANSKVPPGDLLFAFINV